MEFNRLTIELKSNHKFKLNKPAILKNEISKYIETRLFMKPYSFDYNVELFENNNNLIGEIKVNNIIY